MKKFKNADEIVSTVMEQIMSSFGLMLPNYEEYINDDNTLKLALNYKQIKEDDLSVPQLVMLGSYCTTKIIELELKKL